MKLVDLLNALGIQLEPSKCKVHLAVSNGEEDPLDVFRYGGFDEWQRWQSKRNFERTFVISLISMQHTKPNQWLFAGVHESKGYQVRASRYYYKLERLAQTDELYGRLVVAFKRPGRQSYLNGENWSDELKVAEIMAQRLGIKPFPGYEWTILPSYDLKMIVEHSQDAESWRSALSAVAGVYVITDTKTGHLYVGSATGDVGIWGRWSTYARDGHGGNKELKNLLEREGAEYASNFQYGVLEIADSHASEEYILARENYWKNLLDTKSPHGYNAN